MYQLLLIILAAIFKAASDTIKHHPDTSIFKNSQFWIGEGKTFPFTKYKVDGWHISNSLMISSFISLIFFKLVYNKVISFFVLGVIFILVFNLFYNKIFRLKNWRT